MKKLTLFSILLILSSAVYSQWNITFDGEPWDESWMISIDTANPQNIWQIGMPQKTFFDSAYSHPKAIVTDTILNYPPDNSSFFYLTFFPYIQGWWPFLSFNYKMDSDSLSDFGTIEASWDKGQTYINIITASDTADFEWYITKVTNDSIILQNGQNNNPFTGKSDGWYHFDCHLMGWPYIFPYNDTIIYKFTFQSSATINSKEGWLLDNFYVGSDIEGVNNQSGTGFRSIAYPNPSNNRISFTVPVNRTDLIEIQIINVTGTIIKTLQLSKSDNNIDISDLSPGVYFYQLTDKSGHSNGKFIKF